MSLTEDLYKEIIIEHSQNPSHQHAVPDANFHESGVNRSCGDELELELKVEAGKVIAIGVKGRGCSISTASASMMADAVDGMQLSEIEPLITQFKSMLTTDEEVTFSDDLEELEALKGIKNYPIRVKCATLSWNTLEQAIKRALKEG